MNEIREGFQQLLDDAVHFHGHLCGGQVIGVRMAMAGLRELAIENPRGKEGRDLVIFVESDRCATDAIIAVTGRTPGKRSIKMMDYGKMAATFIETRTGNAVRINVRGDSNEKITQVAKRHFPHLAQKQATLEAMRRIAEEDLLKIQKVSVRLEPRDLPGEPLSVVMCHQCGEMVRDMRHVQLGAKVLCRPCAQGSDYYTCSCGGLGASETEKSIISHRSDHATSGL
ncbi:MAG: FmdE family protein [Desulfatitalea sp.]